MGILSKLKLLNRHTLPPLWRCVLRLRHPVRPVTDHLDGAIEWLCRAHDQGGGGVAGWYGYMVDDGKPGWSSPYPETTGFILPTLLDAAAALDRPELRERAEKMGAWLLGLQLPDGSFGGGLASRAPEPTVFNTGQILKGLHRLAVTTGDERTLDSAGRAATWLTGVVAEDGAFRTHLSPFVAVKTQHTFNARVAWILLQTGLDMEDERAVEAATANLRFARSRQEENGWFRENGMKTNEAPCLHETAYATRALLMGGLLLDDEDLLCGARLVADALLARQEQDGALGGDFFRRDWTPVYGSTCLTGLCQIAIVWMILGEQTEDERYLTGACRALRFVCSTQDLSSRRPGIRGGVPGSFVLNGAYMSWAYPNWAAKFLVDALLRLPRGSSWA